MIGIIGSGLDSMIVTRAVREKIPGIDVLCFGDNLHIFPAAAFNPDEMIQNAVQGTAFLVGLGARLILIASHTLSCIAGAAVAESAGVPVQDIITSSVNRAAYKSRHHRIGIIGSRTIIESGLYPEKIREQCPEAGIYTASTPLLVPLIDEGWLKKTGNRHDRQKIPDSLEDPPDRHAHSGQRPIYPPVARDTAKNR